MPHLQTFKNRSGLLHHQLPYHVLMMWAADDAAHNFELALLLGRKVNPCGASGLNRLLNPQVRNIKAMLHVAGCDIQFHRFSAFHVNHVRLDVIFLHDYVYLLGRSFGFLASRGENQ